MINRFIVYVTDVNGNILEASTREGLIRVALEDTKNRLKASNIEYGDVWAIPVRSVPHKYPRT